MSSCSEQIMPESKADRSRRSNEEIVNFLEHGDARGQRWLEAHPDARERAEQYRARKTHASDVASLDGSQTTQSRT
jgi:hypothetical protein